MLEKKEEAKKQIQFMSLEDLVPENHVVRKLEKAIDLSFIYEEVKGLYSEKGSVSNLDIKKSMRLDIDFDEPLVRQLVYKIYVISKEEIEFVSAVKVIKRLED